VFSLEITKNAVSMKLGDAYIPVGSENAPWENSENPDLALRRNEFQINGQKVFYYTMLYALPAGGYDCFIMAADLAMLLDVDVVVPSTGGIQILTQTPFGITPAVLGTGRLFLWRQQCAGGRCHHRGDLLPVSVGRRVSDCQHIEADDMSVDDGGHRGRTDF